MGLTGNLARMPLIEAMRIINLGQSTGSLRLKSAERSGSINFYLGEVVYAGIDDSPLRLGDLMIRERHLNRDQLDRVLAMQHRSKPWRPLGEICIEMGFITMPILREVISTMIVQLVTEMTGWSRGFFRFEEGIVTVSDQITMDMREILARQSGGVSLSLDQLLAPELDSADAGGRPGVLALDKGVVGPPITEEQAKLDPKPSPAEQGEHDEVDAALMAMDAGSSAFTEDIDALAEEFFTSHPYRGSKESKNILRVYREGNRLKSTLARLHDKRHQGEITLILLSFATDFFQRGLLFFVKNQVLLGLGHFGLDDSAVNQAIRKLRIPAAEEPVDSALNSAVGYKAKLPAGFWQQYLAPILGDQQPDESVILPIKVLNKPILLLYGDNAGEPPNDDLSTLRLFMQQVGMAFEIALLAQQK
jgi:hypothetical protein